MKAVVEMKTKDFDGFVAGMRAMADAATTGTGPTMKALVFGARPDPARAPAGADRRAREDAWQPCPFGLHEMEDARPIHPDWVVTRPILSGVCGSDTKLVLGEFEDGDIDNPMAAFSSLPHVPGHEVVAEVVASGAGGPGRRGRAAGGAQPVAELRPAWDLSPCARRAWAGDLNMCWSFTKGDISPGRPHRGGDRSAPGAWAELLATHSSMLFPVPEDISDDAAAVLADPFSVSFHAILRNPPPPAGRVVVFGAGALGLASVAILHALYPGVEVAVVARFPAQFDHGPRLRRLSWSSPTSPAWPWSRALAEWSGGVLHRAFDGLPMAQPGHIDVVYDSVAKPETLRGGRAGPGRTGPARLHRRGRPGSVGVDPGLLQGAHHRRVQRLRHGGVRGRPQARHRALPGPGGGGPDRPDLAW
jgi:threonine dehydrogenase-like Zn-dependent dehydrogenase